MKKNRANAISKLTQAAEKVGGGEKSYEDKRFWAPTVDKAKNGFAIIRFLPACKGEELPWVRYWDHGFKGPTGRWYIENSLTSIGQQDPVSDANTKLWNSGIAKDKATVRERKRRLHYVANIEVISDPANPANDGKQFLYKFGKKIFDKILDLMQPAFQDEKPVNPFDFWEGANFKIKIRDVEGYRNYDKSEFDKPAPHRGGDEKALESIYEGLYPLQDFLDPKNYKSYSELARKFAEAIGENGQMATTAEASTPGRNSDSAPDIKYAPAPAPQKGGEEETTTTPEGDEGGTDETLSYFAKLAKQS